MIKINVTPVAWGMVNQTQLSHSTNKTRYIPAFLCHRFTTIPSFPKNHISVNNKLSTNLVYVTTSSNKEPKRISINPKTGWRHRALGNIALGCTSLMRGTGPILVAANPPIPFVLGMSSAPLEWIIAVCWLIVECIASQCPAWQSLFEIKQNTAVCWK